MDDPEVHIAALEAAGLIDATLAAQLRAAAAATSGAGSSVAAATPSGPGPAPGPGSGTSFFGPAITVGELFAYLGGAFLLGGWIAFIASLSTTSHPTDVMTGALALSALVTFGLGLFLARGDRRRRRGAGVAFLVTTFLAAGSAAYLVQLDFLINTLQGQAPGVLIALVAVVVAAGLRRVLPAVATQVGLVLTLTGLAGAILSWVSSIVYPTNFGSGGGYTTNPAPTPAEPVGLVVAAALWWLLVALGLGLLALYEARREGSDPAAGRRASTTRFLAGLVAVGGVANELTHSGSLGGDQYGRLLEPWIADLALLAIAAVLLERAFRRDATAFILPAAIGLVLAMTDFNFSYLAQSTYVGLLIEGAILLVVGFIAGRLRQRLRGSGRKPPPTLPDALADPPAATIQDR
jgi:hypothetical protein